MKGTTECTGADHQIYNQDRFYLNDLGGGIVSVFSINDVITQLALNGPLGSRINLYSDLYSYESGIYHHI